MYSYLARNPIYTVILRLFHRTHWKNDFLQNIVWPFIVWSTEWKIVYSNCKFQSNAEDSMKLNKHTTQQMNNACMCNVQMCIYIHETVCTNNRFWIESFSIANIHHICIKWIVKMQFLLDLSFISSYYFVHSFLLLSLTLYHKYTYICTMCNAHSVDSVLAFAILLNCKHCSCRPAFNFEHICMPLFWFKWKQNEPNDTIIFSNFGA